MNTALAEATEQLQFDAREKPNVPVRHMEFNFDSANLDDRFYEGTELASAYFEALSIFLTYGEDLVIDCVNR